MNRIEEEEEEKKLEKKTLQNGVSEPNARREKEFRLLTSNFQLESRCTHISGTKRKNCFEIMRKKRFTRWSVFFLQFFFCYGDGDDIDDTFTCPYKHNTHVWCDGDGVAAHMI